jgi:diadenosine tetraphosphate (Ap4A) HIT family hydrolase
VDDCLFCRIVAGKVPAKLAHEDDAVIAVHDVFPRAPFHVLVMPKRHVARLSLLEDEALGGRLLQVVRAVAAGAGHGAFRMVVNNGADAGQSVEHLHLHVLAGRPFSWPPG